MISSNLCVIRLGLTCIVIVFYTAKMPFFLGILLAIGFILLVRRSRSYVKEKWTFAIGLIVTALIYVGLGLSDSTRWTLIELAGVPVYAVFAWLGLKKSGWFLAAGWG